jgi:glycyl-tRNA synthetase beta chain
MSEQRELFIEIGCEEIPAGEVMVAVDWLREDLAKGLDERRLHHGAPKVYATPRRLAVAIPAVDARQADSTREVAGPPVKVAFKDGKPTPAAEGFAKQLGLTVKDLVTRPTPKGDYLFASIAETGKPAAQILPELVTGALGRIPFKRTMRWGEGEVAFSRPILWIVALFGGEVVRLSYAGVESGRQSRGHRFLRPESFEVKDSTHYLAELSARSVVVDVAERRARIVAGAAKLAQGVGGRIRPDEGLLDEVVQLVELPLPLLGEFDARYLDIPQEVLISEMRQHQRYLSVVDAAGKLMPYFVVVANTTVKDDKVVLNGYRRPLLSRFADGAFFYREDQKTPLAGRVDRLKDLAFHRALGSVYEKVERAVKLAFYLAGALGPALGVAGLSGSFVAPSDLRKFGLGPQPSSKEPADLFRWQLARAGYLMKADLTTSMVFEFPELQGVMGRAYAELGGEPKEVARAIEEHYLPRNAGDELPKANLGALLGMADRLDTIAGIFSTGKGPSGTADPYGLRRAALGVLHMLKERSWHLSLSAAVDEALERVLSREPAEAAPPKPPKEGKEAKDGKEPSKAKAPPKREPSAIRAEVLEFFRGRLRGVLTGTGLPADVVEAVLAAGYDDVVDVHLRANALSELRTSADFESIATAFKRVSSILKDQTPTEVTEQELGLDVERQLFAAGLAAEAAIRRDVAARDFGAAFRALLPLRPVVDAFFEKVMVMDPDLELRRKRVALLGRIQRAFAPLADFTKLGG